MIHQYKLNGYNIVIDANSGAVHSVDDVAYDVIEAYSAANETGERISGDEAEKIAASHDIEVSEIYKVIEDIDELSADGLLFSDDPYEAIASEMKSKQSVLKAICLHVAHGCNMDCEYCFAGKGEYSGKSGMMSLDTGKAALDYLVANSGNRTNLEVDFFGGEPLLNWDVCKDLVAYGRTLEKKYDKKINFTLTTNGILVDDDVMEFSNREFTNVVMSLDGRRSVHDRMRHSKVPGGTYDEIVEKFRRFAGSRDGRQYYMRGTYTAYNKDFAKDVIEMADLGFRETSIEPVVSSPDAPYALHMDDLDELKRQYEDLACEMLNRSENGEGFNFYHYNIDLEGGPCIYKRVSGCGVATEYVAVTPTGDIYPCHQFVGDDNMLMGNIYDGITKPEILEPFLAGNNIYTRDKCRDCFAKLYCAGGCAANNYHSNGDINKVYEFGCELHRKRIECAIMMKVANHS